MIFSLFWGFSILNLTPFQASRVLNQAETRMYPAHKAGILNNAQACKDGTCAHIIQPSDLSEGYLGSILIPSDYGMLDLVSLI